MVKAIPFPSVKTLSVNVTMAPFGRIVFPDRVLVSLLVKSSATSNTDVNSFSAVELSSADIIVSMISFLSFLQAKKLKVSIIKKIAVKIKFYFFMMLCCVFIFL